MKPEMRKQAPDRPSRPVQNVSSDLRLLVPDDDVAEPELSIVIPALNEELTIGRFVDWCREGLERANVRGEIVIIEDAMGIRITDFKSDE